ncbi:MAG: EF-hand domain-containing protein [Planctomycetales bacterium]|nr:EF-hand domain-containing protein [Planctomycetales bacterium]
MARAIAMFRRLDRNGDGKIQRDEAPPRAPFDRLDADGDGVVTREEWMEMSARRSGR